MSTPVIRILSDIHYADCGSWVHELRSIAPLLDGPDRVIVNGDAIDTQLTHRAAERVEELQAFFGERVPSSTWITGNHDPDISEIHEVQLAEGRMWITHGDVFFDDVAPWSRKAPEIRRRVRAQAAHLTPEQFRLIEQRFQIFREACQKLPSEQDPNRRGQLARFRRIASVLSNLRGVAEMLRVWRELPDIALEFSMAQRPLAQVIVTGHTHRHGVWHRSHGRVVVNTGSFCPPTGGQLVDVSDDRVTVRRIVRKNDEFRVGATVADFRLAAPAVSAITARA